MAPLTRAGHKSAAQKQAAVAVAKPKAATPAAPKAQAAAPPKRKAAEASQLARQPLKRPAKAEGGLDAAAVLQKVEALLQQEEEQQQEQPARPVTRASLSLKRPAAALRGPLTEGQVKALCKALHSEEAETQLEVAQQLRHSLERSELSLGMLEQLSSVLPRLVAFLTEGAPPELQLEAVKVLRVLALQRPQSLVLAGAAPGLVELLKSPRLAGMREEAAWALGAVAADVSKGRNCVLESGAVEAVVSAVKAGASLALLRNCSRALSKLCSGEPPSLELATPMLPLLLQFLSSSDEDVVPEASEALAYWCDCGGEHLHAAIEAGASRKLVQRLAHRSPFVYLPALRAVTMIASAGAGPRDSLLQNGALPSLKAMLSHDSKAIRIQVCETVAHIAAGTSQQVQAVMGSGLLPPVLQLLRSKAEPGLRAKVATAIGQAASQGIPVGRFLLGCCIEPLVGQLQERDHECILSALQALEGILESGGRDRQRKSSHAKLLEKCKGVAAVKKLSKHSQVKICESALRLLEQHSSVAV